MNYDEFVVGSVLLPDRNGTHYMRLVLLEDRDAIGGNFAQCEFDFDSKGNHVGDLVFIRGVVEGRFIAHEAAHVALCFAGRLMQQPGVLKMTEEEQGDYFNECVATLTENVYEQVEQTALLHGF